MAEQLRKIQHDAYYGVCKAAAIVDLQLTFMEREMFFTTLRDGLHISPEQHHALLNKLQQDESVKRIRDALDGSVKRPRPSGGPVGKAPSVPVPKVARLPAAKPAKPAKVPMGGHAAGGIPVINEHVGERLQMYWPEEGGWFDAIISDYKPATDEHCLTYHINTPDETFEWIHLKDLKTGEYKRLGKDPNLASLNLTHQAEAGRSAVPARGGRGPAGKAGGAVQAAVAARPGGLADLESAIDRARDPKKLDEVQAQLAAQAEAMRQKLQQLQSDSEDDDGAGMTESESE